MSLTPDSARSPQDSRILYAFLRCYCREDQIGQAIGPLRSAIAASQLELITFGHVLKRAPSLHLYLGERPSKTIKQLPYILREFDHFIEAEDRSGNLTLATRNLAEIVKRMAEDPNPQISWGDLNSFEIYYPENGKYELTTIGLLL